MVLNLDDWAGDMDALRQQFKDWDIPNLKQVLVAKDGQLVGNGFDAGAGTAHPVTQELIADTFAITSTVSVLFTLDKFDSRPAGLAKDIALCVAYLQMRAGDADAVLVTGGDLVLFVQKNDMATLNKVHSYWNSSNCQDFALPWKMETLPEL